MRFILTLFTFVSLSVFGQTDFNDYKTLQSKGQLPDDFTSETFQKIEEGMTERREGLSPIEQREFLEKTGYAIDDLLHSGLVVYGDDISTYVEKVADKLLKSDKSLRNELRFYTLKSNVTNAFSTDQGIIFVTTGLIAQLTSEAQLAYILAHEIMHYTEKHVVESFTWSKNSKFNHNWITQLSIYKKDKEFEADRLAIDMYRKAGYSKDEIVPTFDVLLYSYLPFDEIEVPQEYFSSEKMYLPNYLFPAKEYPIKADEDADDSQSTHPNIRKRKDAVVEEIEKTKGTWKNNSFIQTEERFIEIRDIARFENVRTSILNADIGDAIYSIFLLERKYPESIYLKRMKAKAWLALYQYEKLGQISQVISKSRDYEGFSADVHYMVRKFNRNSLTTMALRQVYDLYKADSTDNELSKIYDFMLRELGEDTKFDIDDYSSITFQAAIDSSIALNEIKDSITVVDTVEVKESKYDRIKSKTNVNENLEAGIDTTKYYYYGLSDIISDPHFLKRLDEEIEINKERQKREDAFDALSRSEQKSFMKDHKYDHLKIGCDELIVVEPKVYSYRNSGVDNVKSEKLESTFSEALEESAELSGITVYPIDSRSISKTGDIGFNERTALISFFRQIGNNNYRVNPFPVDFSLLGELEANYGTSNVLFTIVEHSTDADIQWGYLLYGIFIPPTIPAMLGTYVPIKLMQRNHTEITLVMLYIKSGEVVFGDSYYIKEPLRKMHLEAHMYDLFKKMNAEK